MYVYYMFKDTNARGHNFIDINYVGYVIRIILLYNFTGIGCILFYEKYLFFLMDHLFHV